MRRLLLLLPLLAGCATPKIAASEALGPELLVQTVPARAEIFRDGTSLGLAPVTIPVKSKDTSFALEAHQGGFLSAKVTLDAAGLRQAGGGEAWIALKPDTMGTDTPDLDAQKPEDLDRGGVALSKAKRCDEALQFFARALAVNPGFGRAHRDRARCLAHKKQFDQAAVELEQYLNLDSDAPDSDKVNAQIAKLKAHDDYDLTGVADGPPKAR